MHYIYYMDILIETLNHFFSLDFGWVLGLISQHIVFTFIFVACAVYFYEKKWLGGTIFLILFLWAFVAFLGMVQWVFLPVMILVDFFLSNVMTVFDKPGSLLSKHYGWISVVRFCAVLVIFNVFILPGGFL